MFADFRCTACGKRYTFSAGRCGACLNISVIYDGAESKAARERQEREEEQRRAAEREAEAQRKKEEARRKRDNDAARGRNERQTQGTNPLTKPGWNTPVAVIIFIAAAIFLGTRDLDWTQIFVGAGIAAIVAGVFYRMALALAGVAGAVWLVAHFAFESDKPRPIPTPPVLPGTTNPPAGPEYGSPDVPSPLPTPAPANEPVAPPPVERRLLIAAGDIRARCIERYVEINRTEPQYHRPMWRIEEWCGCTARNLASAMSDDERRLYDRDPEQFYMMVQKEPSPGMAPDHRLAPNVEACTR